MKKRILIKSGLVQRYLDKYFANKLAVVGLVVVVIIILASLFAPFITKYEPDALDMTKRYLPVSSQHLLGTDSIGRDVFTRILYGGRLSIFIGVTSALGATLIGVILGCLSGYFGGKTDSVVLYMSEIFMTFPQLILILIFVSFMGRDLGNLIMIFSITGWMSMARIVRGKILTLREEAFVESCRANGINNWLIMFNHLLPNMIGIVLLNFTIRTAYYILAEAGLSFIGLGVDPSTATWGNMINSAKNIQIVQDHLIMWVAPGVAISLFVIGMNVIGNGIRDVFDPKL